MITIRPIDRVRRSPADGPDVPERVRPRNTSSGPGRPGSKRPAGPRRPPTRKPATRVS